MTTQNIEHPYLATVSNPQQIHDFPVNNSSAKQLFSFSKSTRFPDKYYKPNCNIVFYDVDPKLFRSNRTTAFKGGNRSDFTKKADDVPPPNAYEVKNFNLGGAKGRGASFGKSRSEIKDLQALIDKDLSRVPGPGTYNNPDMIKSARNFSFRLKTQPLDSLKVDVGPGQYNVPETINAKTFNFNSKFANVPTSKIMPPALGKRRVPRTLSQPSVYNLKTELNTQGTYFLSKFKNSMCRRFDKANRQFYRLPSAKPGPGEYLAPSEFGFYLSSKINKGKENRL